MTWGGVTVGSEAHERTVPRGETEAEGRGGQGEGGGGGAVKILTTLSKSTAG